MDALFFRALAPALCEAMTGARIGKFWMPAEGFWCIETHRPGAWWKYLLVRCAGPGALVFLSAIKPDNPQQAPAQAMWLRKRVSSRFVTGCAADWQARSLVLSLSQGQGAALIVSLEDGLSLADAPAAGARLAPVRPNMADSPAAGLVLKPAWPEQADTPPAGAGVKPAWPNKTVSPTGGAGFDPARQDSPHAPTAGLGPEPVWPDLDIAISDDVAPGQRPFLSRPMRRALAALPDSAAREAYDTLRAGGEPAWQRLCLSPDMARAAGIQAAFDPGAGPLAAALASGQEGYFGELARLARSGEAAAAKTAARREKRLRQRLADDRNRLEGLAALKTTAEAIAASLDTADPKAKLPRLDTPTQGQVELDPALTVIENMDRLYKLAAKGKRGLAHLARREAEAAAGTAHIANRESTTARDHATRYFGEQAPPEARQGEPRRDGPWRDGPGRDESRRDGPLLDGPRRDGPLLDGPRRDGPQGGGPPPGGTRRDGPPSDKTRRDGSQSDGTRHGGTRRDEPQRTGPRQGGPAKKSAGKSEAVEARRYVTSDGFTVLRGKNAKANHLLLSRVAGPHDYWLHAEGGPGAHVILRRDHPGVVVPRRSLEEAAALAALAGWERDASKARVICALAKNVRHIKGADVGAAAVDIVLESLSVSLDPSLETRLRQG